MRIKLNCYGLVRIIVGTLPNILLHTSLAAAAPDAGVIKPFKSVPSSMTTVASQIDIAEFGMRSPIPCACDTCGTARTNDLTNSSSSSSNLTRATWETDELQKRTFDRGAYVAELSSHVSVWLPLMTNTTSSMFRTFPADRQFAFGVKGFNKSTSIIVVSNKGGYISHIPEIPMFTECPLHEFKHLTLESLQYGSPTTYPLNYLIEPGKILHRDAHPKIFILTPFTDPGQKLDHNIATTFRWEVQVRWLQKHVQELVPGSGIPNVYGYINLDPYYMDDPDWMDGRAILFSDTWKNRPVQWRLYLEDRLIAGYDGREKVNGLPKKTAV